jgi:2-keto-3-deoxy-6-phosphogluconate aldolase
MDLQEDVLNAAKQLSLPVLSGGACTADFRAALRFDASALKIHPSSVISPAQVQQILTELWPEWDSLATGCPPLSISSSTATSRASLGARPADTQRKVYISGGVKPELVEAYLRCGVTDVIVGLDASVLSAAEMSAQLRLFDDAVRQALLTAPAVGTTEATRSGHT